MESLIYKIFIKNWQRKIVALIAAIIIWLFVNQQITDTITIRNVPIRIVNLPPDKTVVGLLPNGILHKKIALTLSGTKDVIEILEPGDLEILIDAASIDHNDWIAQITKKNLVSLNPSIDLANNITQVDHAEFVLKLNRLITSKIPITILPPIGDAPPGYDFLDIWPGQLMQTVSGPEEDIQKLKAQGVEISFDLNNITQADLDTLKTQQEDEISFPIPTKWKQIRLPHRNNVVDEINDPDARSLRIDFLRKASHPLNKEIALQIFFPLKTSEVLNPKRFSLAYAPPVKNENGIDILSVPLFTRGVSKLFADIIKNNIELVITAALPEERQILQWSHQIINPSELEDLYVATMVSSSSNAKNTQNTLAKKREILLRNRFRDYMQRLTLWIAPDHKLSLESKLEGEHIKLMSY